ncbi:hypothetical protein AVEN_107532-1 [Araneus ventricosus]|uniref:Uncharacterized protein n=1 Tax=Araneus ventricosus TaxID=182803 RepID=A0A4Y2HSF8_ARAVE|nr:hypothetical protein AVEN_107532-1 [Araneus ventricosus]
MLCYMGSNDGMITISRFRFRLPQSRGQDDGGRDRDGRLPHPDWRTGDLLLPAVAPHEAAPRHLARGLLREPHLHEGQPAAPTE